MQVLEDYEAQRETEPQFEPDQNRIGDGWFVRVTFPNGESDTIRNNFKSREDAIRWIRCDAIVWLWRRRELEKKNAAG